MSAAFFMVWIALCCMPAFCPEPASKTTFLLELHSQDPCTQYHAWHANLPQ